MHKRFFSYFVSVSKIKQVENYLADNNLEFLLDKKDILLDDSNLFSNNKNLILKKSIVFIKTSKLIKYRRSLSLNKRVSSILTKNSYYFDFKIVNGFLNQVLIVNDYNFFVRYQQNLFSKNFNLFLDLIKITNLLCQNLVQLKLFVYLLSSLFRTMHKRQHNRFIFFVSNLFKYILSTYPNVCGLRLEVSGRLLGKPRASNIKIENGFLGLNSFSSNKYTYQTHVYTLYGVFGFKCYINFKNNN